MDAERKTTGPPAVGAAAQVGRKTARVVVSVLVIVALGLAGTEIVLRLFKIQPRVQIIRHQDYVRLFDLDGTVMWEQSTDRQNLDCAARRGTASNTVMVFGDSILYGIYLSAEKTFSSILEKKLANAERPSCVMNFSQPGFTFLPKYALAKKFLPEHRPAVVFWEIWYPEPTDFAMLGENAYNLADFEVGEDGYPHVFRLPQAVNRWFFGTSRLYEYMALGLAPRKQVDVAGMWHKYVAERLSKVVELAAETGTTLVLVFCPPLDRSFSTFRNEPLEWRSIVSEFASAHDVPVIRLEDALAGIDYRDIRMDSCCHFNAAGHNALADVFFAKTTEILDHRANVRSQYR